MLSDADRKKAADILHGRGEGAQTGGPAFDHLAEHHDR